MAKSLKPKKGLEVKIIAGKYKGQVGKVCVVFDVFHERCSP